MFARVILSVFRDMKIKTKLTLSFFLVTCISSVSGVIGLFSMGSVLNGSGGQAQETSAGLAGLVHNTGSIIMMIIIVVAFVLSIIISVGIANNISRRVKAMTKLAQHMAEGDLNNTINVKNKDEIGQLCTALINSCAKLKAYIADITLNIGKLAEGDLCVTQTVEYKGDFKQIETSMKLIADSMNDTISNIYKASDQVFSSSNQVSGSAESLAQGATEQASSIEELSASISEISGDIKQSAAYASKARENVSRVCTELEESNKHMDQMLAAMSRINSSSKEIGKIIKTIEDIAFQTNILALNAAVEAARAGDAGKGFAVVADEVRNLAGKSAEAAKNTTTMIQNSIAEVENGTKIAGFTASSLEKVVDNVKSTVDTFDNIAQITGQQANAIDQIETGIEQISGVVQTNSATSEESAAASEQLSSQAAGMKTLVEKFKLYKDMK